MQVPASDEAVARTAAPPAEDSDKLPIAVVVGATVACIGFFILCVTIAALVWLKCFRKGSGQGDNSDSQCGQKESKSDGSQNPLRTVSNRILSIKALQSSSRHSQHSQNVLDSEASGGAEASRTSLRVGESCSAALITDATAASEQVDTDPDIRDPVHQNRRESEEENQSITVLLRDDQGSCDQRMMAPGVPQKFRCHGAHSQTSISYNLMYREECLLPLPPRDVGCVSAFKTF